jgi:hypothetical protein
VPLNSPHGDPIETSTPFTLIATQKDNINVILDEQVVLIRDGKVQRYLICWVGQLNSYCT